MPTTTGEQHPEPENGTALLGFINSRPAGVWYRDDPPGEPDPHRWASTYVTLPKGRRFTWEQAQQHGAAWWAPLHTNPTPEAYEAAVAALHSRDRTIDALQAKLDALDPAELLAQLRGHLEQLLATIPRHRTATADAPQDGDPS